MLREFSAQKNWNHLTLTALRGQNVESSKRRFLARPEHALLSAEAREADVERLLRQSFEGIRKEELYTLSALQAQVLERFPREVDVIGDEEDLLLEKLVVGNGEVLLDDWYEIEAAEALLSRLWCGYRREGENIILTLPEKLLDPAAKASSDPHRLEKRMMLNAFRMTVESLLYLQGSLHEYTVLGALLEHFRGNDPKEALLLARRYLQSSFDYVVNADGKLTLLHPGMANLHPAAMPDTDEPAYPDDILFGACRGILPEEEALHETLCRAIAKAIRPENDAEETAEDLRLLVKQGISFEDLQKVLGEQLMLRPTEYMTHVLYELYRNTPRWPHIKNAFLN